MISDQQIKDIVLNFQRSVANEGRGGILRALEAERSGLMLEFYDMLDVSIEEFWSFWRDLLIPEKVKFLREAYLNLVIDEIAGQ